MNEGERHLEVAALKRRSEHYRKGYKIICMQIRPAVQGAETTQHTYNGIKAAASSDVFGRHKAYIKSVSKLL